MENKTIISRSQSREKRATKKEAKGALADLIAQLDSPTDTLVDLLSTLDSYLSPPRPKHQKTDWDYIQSFASKDPTRPHLVPVHVHETTIHASDGLTACLAPNKTNLPPGTYFSAKETPEGVPNLDLTKVLPTYYTHQTRIDMDDLEIVESNKKRLALLPLGDTQEKVAVDVQYLYRVMNGARVATAHMNCPLSPVKIELQGKEDWEIIIMPCVLNMRSNRQPTLVIGVIQSFDHATGTGEVVVGDTVHRFHVTSYSSRLGKPPREAATVDVVLQNGFVLRIRDN